MKRSKSIRKITFALVGGNRAENSIQEQMEIYPTEQGKFTISGAFGKETKNKYLKVPSEIC